MPSAARSAAASVVLCVVLRVGVCWWFPALGAQLDQTVEFSTPMTSYRALREGVFLLGQGGLGSGLYDGGVVHHPVLLLKLVQAVCSRVWPPLLFAVADALVGLQVTAMVMSESLVVPALNMPVWIPGTLFALNPLALLSCVSLSSTTFNNLCVSSALYFALVHDNTVLSAMALALASYLDVYMAALLVPLVNVVAKGNNKNKNKNSKSRAFVFITTYILTLVLLVVLSVDEQSGITLHQFLKANYIDKLCFNKVFPNLGLWWYFFIEMFQEFVPFFKSVFNVFCLGMALPLALRFHEQPVYSTIICLGWLTLTKPYPTLGDAGFFFAFIPWFQPLFGYLKYSTLSVLLYLHAILLAPIFYHLWIDLGSGNSNFFYAISLVYAMALGLIVTDLMWAMVRFEYDAGVPDFKLKLTQI